MNNVKSLYLREIERLLPYDSTQKKHCVTELENSISDYLDEHPDATLEKLYAEFGHPEDIAEIYLDRVDPKQLSKEVSVKRRIAFGVIAAIIILVVIIGAVSIFVAHQRNNFYSGYFVETYNDLPENADCTPTAIEKH